MDHANKVLSELTIAGVIAAEERRRMTLASCPRRRRDLLARFRAESSVEETNWAELPISGGKELRAADRARAWFPLHRSCRFRFHSFSRP